MRTVCALLQHPPASLREGPLPQPRPAPPSPAPARSVVMVYQGLSRLKVGRACGGAPRVLCVCSVRPRAPLPSPAAGSQRHGPQHSPPYPPPPAQMELDAKAAKKKFDRCARA